MAGDYSRKTHDPRKRFAAVLMQQGRVQVDGDWNEQAAISLDRARRQARDTFGRAAVSRFSTADAFRIGMLAGPPRDLSISPGRMYVEGLLAEAFAADGTPITYLKQPFLPDPPALPAQGAANVFLDVWQREVTWVEDPSLLDVALGGVDTATRLQTVWQVRASSVRTAVCGVDLDDLFPPSPARLTTRAVAPPAPDDPCLIAPKTGYRGIENRLYRVEVHVGGAPGAARFKYSRDNASVRSPVLGMRREMRGGKEVSVLSVARIGRDPALRIAAGDWVEITDEPRFLNGESGAMAQVAEPPLEEAGQDGFAVVLDRVIPAAGDRSFGSTTTALAERRTRIIRWDQAAPRNTLDANGLMAVAGGMIALEEGVEIDFTLDRAGAQYRAGDWWVFAARTANASVEELAAAPPHGPIHHFAQLAAVANIAGNDDPSDCRTLWPPLAPQGGDGCCTMVVRPGEDIQKAIDSLPPEGGCVCLKAGVHPLRGPLVIRRSRIALHAEAPGAAMLTRAAEAPLLIISGATDAQRLAVTDITVEGIVFQLGSIVGRTDATGLLVIGDGAMRVQVRHCRFVVQDEGGTVAAVHVQGRDVTVHGCIVEGLAVGVRCDGHAADVSVSGSYFSIGMGAVVGRDVGALPADDAGWVAIGITACDGSVRVLANTIVGYRFGILLGDDATGGKGLATTFAMIAQNVVLRGGPRAQERPGVPERVLPEPVVAQPVVTTPQRDVAQPAGRGTATPRRAIPVSATVASGVRVPLRDTVVVATERADLASEAIRGLSGRETLIARALPAGTLSKAAEPIIAAAERGFASRVPSTAPAPATGLAAEAAKEGEISFAITVAAQNATIEENVIAWRGGPYGGILAGQGSRLVVGNDLVVANVLKREDGMTNAAGTASAEAFAYGIVSGAAGAGADAVCISGNMVSGSALAFALNDCGAAVLDGNIAIGAIAGLMVRGGEGVRISGNAAFGCRIGVLTIAAARVRIEGNVIAQSHAQGILGIHAGPEPAGRVRIAGNMLTRCGVQDDGAVAISFFANDPDPGKTAMVESTEIVVEHNAIHDTGWPLSGDGRARQAHGIAIAAPRVTIHGNDVTWSLAAASDEGQKLLAEERTKPHRAVVLAPTRGQGLVAGTDDAWAGSVTITDNRLRGPSLDALVEVREDQKGADGGEALRFREVLFSGNLIEHWGPLDTPGNRATVMVLASRDALVSVSANVVRGTARAASVLVDGPKEIAWAGNATTGQLIGAAGQGNVVA